MEAWESLPAPPRRTGLRNVLGAMVVWAWIPAIVLPGASLMAGHLLTLPKPSDADPVMGAAIASARPPSSEGRFFALHVLLGSCACSQRILTHLVDRGPRRDLDERVVVVDPEDAAPAERARAAGFDVESITRAELFARYKIEAAPLLVVASPAGKVAYVGGYTDRKQSLAVRDVDLESRLVRGEHVEPLPTFGCAVSTGLQRRVDPLGVRYLERRPCRASRVI